MKIYISGMITGCPIEAAREKFAQAAQQIVAFGHTPVNPFDNGLDVAAEWEAQMVKDIELLLGSDAIYLLKDWENSKGARIEEHIARECGLEIIPQPEITVLRSGNSMQNFNL